MSACSDMPMSTTHALYVKALMCLRCNAWTLLEVEREVGGDDGVLQDLDHRLVDVGVDVTQDVVALEPPHTGLLIKTTACSERVQVK